MLGTLAGVGGRHGNYKGNQGRGKDTFAETVCAVSAQRRIWKQRGDPNSAELGKAEQGWDRPQE